MLHFVTVLNETQLVKKYIQIIQNLSFVLTDKLIGLLINNVQLRVNTTITVLKVLDTFYIILSIYFKISTKTIGFILGISQVILTKAQGVRGSNILLQLKKLIFLPFCFTWLHENNLMEIKFLLFPNPDVTLGAGNPPNKPLHQRGLSDKGLLIWLRFPHGVLL